MWSAAEQTLENKKSKKPALPDIKLETGAPTLKLKMAPPPPPPVVLPPAVPPKGSQRRTSTASDLDTGSNAAIHQQVPKAPMTKPSKKKRQSDAVDAELLDLMEIGPPTHTVPVDAPPKTKKVKLALTTPGNTPKPAELPSNGKVNGYRPLHGLPSKPVSNGPTAVPHVRESSAPNPTGERKIKLSGMSRAGSATATPPAPTPQSLPSDRITPTIPFSDPEGEIVSDKWKTLPGKNLPVRKLRVQKYLQDLVKEPAFAPVCSELRR